MVIFTIINNTDIIQVTSIFVATLQLTLPSFGFVDALHDATGIAAVGLTVG